MKWEGRREQADEGGVRVAGKLLGFQEHRPPPRGGRYANRIHSGEEIVDAPGAGELIRWSLGPATGSTRECAW